MKGRAENARHILADRLAYNQAVESAEAAYLSVLSPIEGYIGKQ